MLYPTHAQSKNDLLTIFVSTVNSAQGTFDNSFITFTPSDVLTRLLTNC